MAAFDPDAYLAEKTPASGGFDPDTYLSEKAGTRRRGTAFSSARQVLEERQVADEGEISLPLLGSLKAGPAGRLLTGIGHGMYNTHLKISDLMGRLPGLERVNPKAWSDQEELYGRTLGGEGFANFGDLTGQTAPLVATGLGSSALARAALPEAWAVAAPAVGRLAENVAPGYIQGGEGGAKFAAGLTALFPMLGAGWNAASSGARALRIPEAARALADLVRGGYVRPTPEAQRLAQSGAKLTLGQMAPSSLFGQTEELAANTVTGGPLTAAREHGATGIRDALLRAVGGKGAKPPTSGAPVAQQIKELESGFTQLYDDALEGARLTPENYLGQGKWRGLLTDETLQGAAKAKGAFELAASAKNINASEGVRQRALGWLQNEATILQPAKSGPNAGTVDARAIQTLRSNIRKAIRKLGNSDEASATREIYSRAEESVTELLEGQLPPERASMLREADTAYRNLLSVKDAAKKAFVDDQEFTPAQLLRAIGNKGATPELEAVTRDAQAVLHPTYNRNGLQSAAVASIPGYKFIGPAWANLANSSPALRAHALKATTRQLAGAPQEAEARLADLIRTSAPPSRLSLAQLLQPGALRYTTPASAEAH